MEEFIVAHEGIDRDMFIEFVCALLATKDKVVIGDIDISDVI